MRSTSRGETERSFADSQAYFTELVERLLRVAGGDLVGVYAGGSYALGAYEQGRSDLDVAVVLAGRPSHRLKERFVAELRHDSLPCPARGLELVLYTADAVGRSSTDAAFELNLNTGAQMTLRVDFEPDPNETHWFPIDRSILAQHGIALFGPPAAEVFARLPKREVLSLLLESLRRQAAGADRRDDVVLNACRSWRYAEEGTWSSKPAAGEWALAMHSDLKVVRSALEARVTEAELEAQDVEGFVASVIETVESLSR
jgi:hypothetical protein